MAAAARVASVVRRVTDSAVLREKARAILNEDRFRAPRTPAPFKGLLRRLGDLLAPVGRALAPVGRFFAHFGWLWQNATARVFLIVAVALMVGALSQVVVRRRRVSSVVRGGAQRAGERDDPSHLERQAEKAESAGDFGQGVRLRFQAGVIRLQDNGRVRRGRTTATRAIGRQLRSDSFDHLGATFDEVAYGGRPATSTDAAQARDAWQRVLSESSS